MPDLPMPKRLPAARGFGRRGFAQAGLIRHPEGLESTGFRLEFIPCLTRGRNDEFYENCRLGIDSN